ncbi:hypothetical protein [Psychrobacillus sp. PGGUH221]|uniref:hypothetical protein n=1 Tax=Psychrobacillus sp. PGGUH221 TaxID=3020058 RepID=UPI0035C75305
MEEAEHLRIMWKLKRYMLNAKKQLNERVFANVKEKHGMRWTTLQTLKKLSMQAMLTFVR